MYTEPIRRQLFYNIYIVLIRGFTRDCPGRFVMHITLCSVRVLSFHRHIPHKHPLPTKRQNNAHRVETLETYDNYVWKCRRHNTRRGYIILIQRLYARQHCCALAADDEKSIWTRHRRYLYDGQSGKTIIYYGLYIIL